MTPPCRPHPDSRVCMVLGNHLAGCSLASCQGCVACTRHNHPRPVQIPAATSDARKRNAERRAFGRDPYRTLCACGAHELDDTTDDVIVSDGLVHDGIVCIHAEAVGL